MFAKYHYLSNTFNKVARVFVGLVNGEVAAFSAILAFPHPKIKNFWKGHRTVVLPDFQGINLSRHMSNFIGEHLYSLGKRYITTTSNPARIAIAKKDPHWVVTRVGRAPIPSQHMQSTKHYYGSSNRLTVSLEWVHR